ncbi:hypothetical protein H4Q26_003523 [Puccinia striiformis f. sp. tritici PST-130]|nr:hypothetical protein H4Q26_003523 [Puccinia striiformis f. sp. tritici PST-130]
MLKLEIFKGKSEADGEIDEQIGNLHQSSASKQQALAIAIKNYPNSREGNGLMVIQNDDQPHWGSPNSSHSTGKRYLPPSGSSPKEGSSDHVNRTRPNSSN